MTSITSKRLGQAPEEGIKAPCVASTTANVSILTGLLVVDSVQTVAGDRVLVRSQTDASENGIYVVAAGVWSRANDWNQPNDVINGQIVVDANSGQQYRTSFTGMIDIDTTDVAFIESGPTNGIPAMTLAQAVGDATAIAGDIVQITDRANAQYKYESGQTPDTFGIVAADAVGLDLVYIPRGAVDPRHVGAASNGSTSDYPEFEYVRDNYDNIDISNPDVNWLLDRGFTIKSNQKWFGAGDSSKIVLDNCFFGASGVLANESISNFTIQDIALQRINSTSSEDSVFVVLGDDDVSGARDVFRYTISNVHVIDNRTSGAVEIGNGYEMRSTYIGVIINPVIQNCGQGVLMDQIIAYKGSHNGGTNAATMTDTSQSWATNELVNMVIVNTTDGSAGAISANSAQVVTATLSGGTDNDWDPSDTYEIRRSTGVNGVPWMGGEIQSCNKNGYLHDTSNVGFYGTLFESGGVTATEGLELNGECEGVGFYQTYLEGNRGYDFKLSQKGGSQPNKNIKFEGVVARAYAGVDYSLILESVIGITIDGYTSKIGGSEYGVALIQNNGATDASVIGTYKNCFDGFNNPYVNAPIKESSIASGLLINDNETRYFHNANTNSYLDDLTSTGNPSISTDDILRSILIPSGSFGNNGHPWRIHTAGQTAANGNTKLLKVAVNTVNQKTFTTTANDKDWAIDIEITQDPTTSATNRIIIKAYIDNTIEVFETALPDLSGSDTTVDIVANSPDVDDLTIKSSYLQAVR